MASPSAITQVGIERAYDKAWGAKHANTAEGAKHDQPLRDNLRSSTVEEGGETRGASDRDEIQGCWN